MFASKDIFLAAPSGGYTISRSVRYRSSAGAYFNRLPTSVTNQNIYTWSAWVKRGALSNQGLLDGYYNGSNFTSLFFYNDTLWFYNYLSASTAAQYATNAVFRDPSAWYHIVLVYDSPNATAGDRCIIYVNGVRQTLTTTVGITQNASGYINYTAAVTRFGIRSDVPWYFDGYMADLYFIDGQALTPSSFGATDAVTGVWNPKKYSGSYGANGAYLNFTDNSAATATTIGKDSSGNGNNYTPNNISVTAGVTYDSMIDSPTVGPTSSNYCVMNAIAVNPSTTASTCTNGNLTISASAANTMQKGTFGISSGSYYFEATLGATVQGFGVGEAAVNSFGTNSSTVGARTFYMYNTASIYTILPGADTAITTGIGSGGTLAVAVDMTNKKLWLGYASSGAGSITWIGGGSPSAGTTPTYTFASNVTEVFPLGLTNGSALNINFGQRPFTYTPPSGFLSLNTQNLATPAISNGATAMAATLYTGTGATLTVANTVGSASFQPDFVWVKSRSAATDHALYDSVRGTTKDVASNTTAAQTTQATGLTAFGSTGFTVGTLGTMNTNAATYVGWQWKAGGGFSTNFNGSISSNVNVGATQGFSVLVYSGTGAAATVGHGLGVVPSMIIVKNTAIVQNWRVAHVGLTNMSAYHINLDATAGEVNSGSLVWNNTAPTSTVFSIGTDSSVSGSGNTIVAYCFAAVAGYSAFGSYAGNSSTDGPFIYCGFRPRWVLIKVATGTTGDWNLQDTSRNPYNSTGTALFPNGSYAEASGYLIDVLSNGFKLRFSGAYMNGSGCTLIYAAFAENPFKYSRAR